jgi:hypothetical protein
VLVGGLECSALELDLIGDALGLDVRPFPFDFPVHGDSLDERRRFVGVVRDSLAAKGLYGGGSFAPVLEQLVGLFARGRLGVALLGASGDRSLCARAVIDGPAGLVADQRGGVVRFRAVNPLSVVRELVSLLSPMRPGPGSSVTITASAATAVSASVSRHRRDDDDFGVASYLEPVRPARRSEGAARSAAEAMLRRHRFGGGYVTVSVRGRDGREGAPSTVSWVDTDAGRYVVVPVTGADGLVRVTYSPADLPRLAHTVSNLVTNALG